MALEDTLKKIYGLPGTGAAAPQNQAENTAVEFVEKAEMQPGLKNTPEKDFCL